MLTSFVVFFQAAALLFAAVAASDVIFTGLICHTNNTLNSDACNRTTLCCCNSACCSWETGRLVILPAVPLPLSEQAAVTAPMRCEFDGPGRVVNASPSLVWLPSLGGCWTADAKRLPEPLPFITAAQANAALHEAHIVVVGDSLLFQFFMRLVAHLRGLTELIQHAYRTDALYASNGTHDFLHIACGYNNEGHHTEVGGDEAAHALHRDCMISPYIALGLLSRVGRPTVIVYFLWDPFLSGLRTDDIAAALGLEPSSESSARHNASSACVRRERLLVVGMNHWNADIELEVQANTSLGRFLGSSDNNDCSPSR